MNFVSPKTSEKESSEKIQQVILCGTQYGQIYLPAIYQKKGVELAGILTRGSDQSVRLAEQYGVSLYTNIERIDESIDIACVAINEAAGTPIAQGFLEKGIATLVEHPISADNIRKLISTAQTFGSICHINSHFSELPPTADFIQLSQKLNKISTPYIINICCNSRTLFSTIDILMRVFGLIQLDKISFSSLNNYRSCTMLLSSEVIKNVSCTMVYQQWRHKQDDSMDSPLGHQITITYPEGVLHLGGSFGPCLWFPLMAAGAPLELALCHSSPASQISAPTLQTIIEWRKIANQQALDQLCLPPDQCPAQHTPAYMVHLCELWTRLFAMLGSTISHSQQQSSPENFWSPGTILNV